MHKRGETGTVSRLRSATRGGTAELGYEGAPPRGPKFRETGPGRENRRSLGRLFAVSAPEQNDEDAVGSAWRERRVA